MQLYKNFCKETTDENNNKPDVEMGNGDQMEGIYIKRRKLKLWIRVLLMIIILVIFSQGIIMILKGITKNKTNKTIYSYNINQDANYNIDIYNNNLFETENLGMDQTYVSNIVKSINTNFKYKYKNNKKIPLNYEYSITPLTFTSKSTDK